MCTIGKELKKHSSTGARVKGEIQSAHGDIASPQRQQRTELAQVRKETQERKKTYACLGNENDQG